MYCWQHHEINGRVQVAAWQLGVAAQDFNSACDRALHHHYVTSPAKLARALLGWLVGCVQSVVPEQPFQTCRTSGLAWWVLPRFQ
jgi:hypothetical protein